MALLDDEDVLNPDRGSGLEPKRGIGLNLYKSASQAYDEVVGGKKPEPVVTAQAPKTLGDLMGMSMSAGTQPAAQPTSKPAAGQPKTLGDLMGFGAATVAEPPAESQSDFGRGWDVSGKQLKQTAYGTAALLGDTFGSDTLREFGMKGYKEAEKEVQAISKPSDSFTTALETGELGKWLKYSSGYLIGQVAEMGVAGIAGAVAGSAIAPGAGTVAGGVAGALEKEAAQLGIRAAVNKMIQKEAADLVKRDIAKDAALEMATKSVYRTIGATTANTFLNATQELGSIYGDAVEEAAKTGQEYSLGKVWLAGVAATAVDSWADSKAVGSLFKSIGGKDGARSIALEALKGGFREGMTEGVQTAIERWGADKDLTSKEAFKEYIDSAAVGILGGSVAGGTSGAISKLTAGSGDTTPPPPGDKGQTELRSGAPKIENTDEAGTLDGAPTELRKMGFREVYQSLNEAPEVAAIMYRDAQTDQERELIMRAVDRAEIQRQFEAALQNPEQLDQIREGLMQNYGQVFQDLKDSLPGFVNDMPPGGIFKPAIPMLEAMRDVRDDQGKQAPIAQELIDLDRGESFKELANRLEFFMDSKPDVIGHTDTMVVLDMGEKGILRLSKAIMPVPDGVTPLIRNVVGSLVFDVLPVGSDTGLNPAPATPATPATPNTPETGVSGKAAGLAIVQERFANQFNEPAENFKLAKAPAHFNKIAKAFGIEIVAYNYTGNNTAIRQKAGTAYLNTGGKPVVAINLTRANQASLFVFGHEVFHVLEQRYPMEAARLAQEIKQYLSQNAKDYYTKLYTDLGKVERTDSEVAADVMGQMFTDREFWRQVGEKNPSLVQKILEVIDSIIAKFRTLEGAARLQIRNELAEYERIREMMSSFASMSDEPQAAQTSTEAKPDNQNFPDQDLTDGENAPPPPVGSVRKGKPAQQAQPTVRELALQEQRNAGWNPDWPFVPADLGNADFRQQIATDPTLSDSEKQAIFEAGKKLGVVPKNESVSAKPAAPESKPANDAKVFMDVIGLLLDGKLPQAAKLFKENDLFGKGFGSFTDIQKLAAQKRAEQQAEPEVIQAPEEDNTVNTTYRRTRGPKKAEAVEEETQPQGQMSLGLGMLVPKETETPAQTRLRKRLDGVVRKAGHINFYNETMLKMQAEIAKIDAELEQLDTIIVKQGDEEQYFRARREDDDRPGTWATYNENAYDFLQDGMIPDKPTNRMDLLARRRLLAEELSVIGRRSTASRAKLYRRTMLRMGDLMRSIVETSVAGGMKREEALAVYGDYVKAWENEARMEAEGERVSQLANERTESTEEDTRTGIDPNQFDMFDGARVAMGVILDSSTMSQVKDTNPKTQVKQAIGAPRFRVDEKRLEKAVLRGLRDGDFTMQDLVYAFRALNIDISRNLLEEGMELSIRKPLDKHLEETGYSPAARLEWLTNMHKVMTLNKGAWSRYSDSEIEIYKQWLDASKSINDRRSVTPNMREADLQDEAFPDLLFNRYTLSEAEGRQELRRVFGDVREVWYQDVAYALRRRPDLANQILGKLGEDKPAFDAWVAAKKAAIAKEAEVMGKSPAFTVLRNMAFPDRSVGDVRASAVSTLDSTPTREVEVFEALQGNEPDTAGLVVSAYRQLQKFASDNGVDPLNIAMVQSKLRPGEDTLPENRNADPVVITMNDGQQLEMASRYSGELLNSIVMDGVGRAANYVDMMRARYGTRFYRSRETRAAGLEASRTGTTAKTEIPGREANLYEQEYIKLANAELSEIPSLMDSLARLNAIRTAKIDPETGEILTDEQADERASAFIEDLENRALKTGGVYDTGSEAPAALRRGETGFGVTLEDRAEQERRAGPPTSKEELADESIDELLNAGVDVEMDNMFEAMNDTTPEEGVDEAAEQQTEEGSSSEPEMAADEETDTEAGSGIVKSLVPGLEYRFRRGPFAGALVPSIVADHIFSITAKWRGAPKINIIPNADHLPPELRDQVKAKLGKHAGAKGLYHGGEVWLFSDHISDLADAEFTLFHEAYGHLGMRAFLGKKFDDFLQLTYNTNQEVRRRVDEMMQTDAVGLLEAVDEVLSDMAAEKPNTPVVKGWIGRIINGLRELGFETVANWLATRTDAELSFVLQQSRKAAQDGRVPAYQGAPSEVRLAQARLPYEMYSGRGGVTTSYARYNPLTASWAVAIATGTDIRQGWNTQVLTDFEEVTKLMRKRGEQLVMRSRSGMYIDFKIASDLQKYFDGRIPEEDRKIEFSKGVAYNIQAIKNIGRHLKRTAIINFQNEYKAVFEVIEDLRAKGRMQDAFDLIPDLSGNYERRTGEELAHLRQVYERPLLGLMKTASTKGGNATADTVFTDEKLLERIGAKTKLIDLYLTAMHAKERNARIAKINPNMPDGGSGLFNSDADLVLRTLGGMNFMPEFREISQILRDMSEYKLKRYLDTGMISAEEFERLDNYENYVNLSGMVDAENRYDDAGFEGFGKKFDSKKGGMALGRATVAEDILSRTIMGFERSIVTANKNTVKQKLLAMLEYNYDPDFAVINRLAYKRVFNRETGQVEEQLDSNFLGRKDVMVLHLNGKPIAIQFKQTGKGTFADAIHGSIYPAEVESAPLRFFGKFNQVIGQMLTTWNPAWVFVNFTRDVQTLYFNAVADNRITRQQAKQMVKYLPKAIAAAFHVATNGARARGADQTMIEYFIEMRAAGGATNFLNFKGLENRIEELEKLLDPKDPNAFQKFGTAAAEFLESINIPMEMAPRIAAYRVMREAGYSKEQAAQFAGEITVNFNMRGAQRWTRQLFLFFNPAVQGSAKLVKLATQNPKTFTGIASGMAAFGFAMNILARAMSGEDDDGKEKLDKVPVFKRATSVVLFPDVPGGAIPIPYGWNMFYAAGHFMADTLVAGTQDMGTTMKRIFQAAFESFAPLGSAGLDSKSLLGTVLKGVTPTALLPIVELWANENRFGAPIVKEANLYGTGKRPNSEMGFDSASPISSAFAKGLNKLTGGDKVEAGVIDMNPGVIDYLISSYLPGIGAETYKFASWATRVALGYETKGAAIPVVDRFTAKIPDGYDFGALRRAKEFINTKYDDFRANEGKREAILAEFPTLKGAHDLVGASDYRISLERQQRKRIEEMDIPRSEKVQMVNESRKREEELVKRVVARLMEMEPSLRPVILASE